MLWPEGPRIQFYKNRQKLQSQKARPSQSVTLSTLINYVHPLDRYAQRPEVLSESRILTSQPGAPLSQPSTPPTAQPAPPYLLSPLGRPGVLRDGLPDGPFVLEADESGWREAPTRSLTDGRQVKTGNEPVLGRRAF